MGDLETYSQLGTLAKAQTIYRLEANLSGLHSLDDAALPALLAQLRADPTWRLTRRAGVLIAEKREQGRVGRSEGWTAPAGGYQQDEGSGVTWRIALRPGPPPAGAAPSAVRNQVPTTQTALRLHGWSLTAPGWEGWDSVACTFQGPTLALEVHEIGRPLALDHLSLALGEVPTWVGTIAEWPYPRETGGWVRALLPPGEPATGEAFASATLADDGNLELFGRFNPGRPGWAWGRILGPTGEAWQEVAIADATVEAPGWSSNPQELFWFDGRVPLAQLPPRGSRVEIWFVPDGGQQAERLGSWPIDPES